MWWLLLFACSKSEDPKSEDPVQSDDDEDTDVPPADDISSVLEPIRAQYGLPALGGALVVGDDVVAIGTVGEIYAGADPVTDASVWHLGSCTKAMTATLSARLVEAGTIEWDHTIGDTFSASVHPDFEDVTLEMLLAMQGGFDEQPDADLWSVLQQPGSVVDQRLAYAEAQLERAPYGLPGNYKYGNPNYIIAGSMLEQVTGESWEALIARELFSPLAMDCGFGPPGVDEPWGHDRNGNAIDPTFPAADNPASLGPAGTVHCPLRSWAKFAAASATHDTALLSEASWAKLHTEAKDAYALGWLAVDRSWGNGIVLNHTGSNTMWYANVWVAPETDKAYLAVTNTGIDDAFVATDTVIGALIGL